jgi:peroxiredoxin
MFDPKVKAAMNEAEWMATKLSGPQRKASWLTAVWMVAFVPVYVASGCVMQPVEKVSAPTASTLSVLDQPIVAITGEELSLADVQNRHLALFFFCGCARCVRTASDLNRFLRRSRSTAVWGFSEMNAADIGSFAREAKTDFPLAPDANASFKQAFTVDHCPTILLVDPDGRVHRRWSADSAGKRGRATASEFLCALETKNDR